MSLEPGRQELDLDALEAIEIPTVDLLGLADDHDASTDVVGDASLHDRHGDQPASATRPVSVYRVTAPTSILGYEPGEIFTAELDPAHERRLIQRGQLERYKSSGRPARPAGASAPAHTTTGGST